MALPELEKLREAIDTIDRKILALVVERVRLVLRVGDVKRAHQLAVHDPERERRVLERLSGSAEEPLDGEAVRRIFERLIDESRAIEERHVSR